MESKKSSPNARRTKRSKAEENNYWDCSVCTYRNKAEAFKCSMCDVRKGTSTRKPRLNPQLVPHAFNPAQAATPATNRPRRESKGLEKKSDGNRNTKARPRLKNVDRSTAMHKEVTVNNVTVVITEFRPKVSSSNKSSVSPNNLDLDSHTTSSSSSASNHGNDLSPADQGHHSD